MPIFARWTHDSYPCLVSLFVIGLLLIGMFVNFVLNLCITLGPRSIDRHQYELIE
jgi:hypothetical protein